MRLALSSDHAGYELKRDLAAILGQKGHAVLDLGTHSTAPCDYPDAAESVAQALRNGDAERGIIVCGSGAGIRAAVCHDTYSAHQAVEHDDMNVLCIGSRVIGSALAQDIVTSFLGATFSGEPRHQRRLDKILAIEKKFSR
jgi:ribose 5-phosphate isomerase B